MKTLICALLLTMFLVGCNESSTIIPGSPDPNITRVELAVHVSGEKLGDIKLELYDDLAPVTVENFLRYVDEGYYNGLLFHRVISEFMVQGGGFDLSLSAASAGDPIVNEADNGLSNLRGTIAMARTNDPHSARSQFFINLVDNPFLDHTEPTVNGWGYAVFGRVIEGMDVVDAIATLQTGTYQGFQNLPVQPVTIQSAVRIQ